MEAEKLTGLPPVESPPPRALERLVWWLIPPAARESVAGDLWELYRSPWQYVCDALRVLPFIIVSQIRRTANLPVLALQGGLLFQYFRAASESIALVVTALVLAALMLAGAYQSGGRPSARRAMIEAMLMGGAAELAGLAAAHMIKLNWSEAPYFMFLGSYLVPLLCLARTAVILWGDRFAPHAMGEMSLSEVTDAYAAFERRAFRRNAVEIAGLVGFALVLACLPQRPPVPLTICAYMATALYLLWDGASRRLPGGANFHAVRARFQSELARQHRLRSFVWWLWLVPAVLQIRTGVATEPLSLLGGIIVALVFGFFIEALNRERRGRIHEEIGGLALVLERTAAG